MATLVRRRDLALPLLTAPLLAQTSPAPANRTPDQELQAARDQLAKSKAELARQLVPMTMEPAFVFKVY